MISLEKLSKQQSALLETNIKGKKQPGNAPTQASSQSHDPQRPLSQIGISVVQVGDPCAMRHADEEAKMTVV